MKKQSNRLGEINYNTQGLEMKIIKYRKYSDIDVEFNIDGYIKEHTNYGDFKKGLIRNPNLKHLFTKNRLGEIKNNKFGSKMEIVRYERYSDVDVYFPEYDWTSYHTTYDEFKKGTIKCPYEPRFFGVGYIGEGKYRTVDENGKITKIHRKWISMLSRCYYEKEQNKRKRYKNCIVCNEWLNYQNFAKWYEENYYEVDGERMCLDKDILIKNNKVYSPDTCIFVPERINTLFIKSNKTRGNLPIGVTYNKNINKICSQCGIHNYKTNKKENVYLGCYNTPEEAFYSYKEFKEKHIKKIADYYKDKIPTKLYDAMYRYEVEITD